MSATAKPIIIPPRLRPGATIGLVTPSGSVHDLETVRQGIAILEEAGFRVKVPAELEKSGYLAGSDAARARQLTEAWRDPEVHAVLAVRGGYGAMRLLPHLEPAAFAASPKILAGFSDITILLNEIRRRTGLVTYHTPVLTTLARSDPASRQSFLATLTGPPKAITPPDLHILAGGRCRGPLIGGNLTSLSHLLGTPYEPDWQDAILFLEDTGEPPYKIDRMLTQLQAAGRLRQLGGLILGTFSEEDDREEKWAELAGQRAQELTGGQIPLWGNFPVGHGARNLSLPVGMTAVMDSNKGRLEFINP
jgi:muramoyltetrapeptide carboxypeptidase